jgi:ketosteroid isomerase-like protein
MTSIDDQTATTLATLARFSAALERRDVDGLIAEMTDDVVLESPGPAPPVRACYEYHAGGH